MWIERNISKFWSDTLHLPVRALIGLRQVGKSTFLHKSKPEGFQYVTLDDPLARQTAQLDPELFFEQYPFPLILDECQLAPQLFPSLKKRVDNWRMLNPESTDSPVWISGSSQILIDKNIMESLAGRVSYFYLHPLSLAEIKTANPNLHIREVLIRGGWPILWANRALEDSRFYADYIRSALEKDVIMIGNLEKADSFSRLLLLLAGRTGNLINPSSLAGDAEIANSTASEWCDLLARLGFIYKLKPYFTNLSKRVIKSPKLYFCDAGLAAHLCGWTEVTPLLASPQAGAIFENLIFSEIIRIRDQGGLPWSLHFGCITK